MCVAALPPPPSSPLGEGPYLGRGLISGQDVCVCRNHTLGHSQLNLWQQSGLTNSAKSPNKRKAENDLSC